MRLFVYKHVGPVAELTSGKKLSAKQGLTTRNPISASTSIKLEKVRLLKVLLEKA